MADTGNQAAAGGGGGGDQAAAGIGDEAMEIVPPEKPKIRFEIDTWFATNQWKNNDIGVETCSICRNGIFSLCSRCLDQNLDGEDNDCDIVFGRCNHGFHRHCIVHWLTTRHVCPLDNQAWAYREEANPNPNRR